MAERVHDLTDLLHAAEHELARGRGDVPTDVLLRRTHGALRAARTRRAALAVGGAAAAVAVVVAGAVAWAPQASVPPAGPGPSPAVTTSTAAAVPGLPPLRQATEEEVRAAPEGSALVLWAQSTAREVDLRRLVPLAHDPWLLLVTPDGEVLQVARVPQGTEMLMSWDRASSTATVHWFDGPTVRGDDASGQREEREHQEVRVLDVLTGRVVGTPDEPPGSAPDLSPDGTREAYTQRDEDGLTLHVLTSGRALVHPLPRDTCYLVGWADDARLLVHCLSVDPVADRADGRVDSLVLLVDATTGAVTQERALRPDEGEPVGITVRTTDGRLVVPLQVGGVDPNLYPAQVADADTPPCRTRLSVLDGLELTPLAEVPAGQLLRPEGVVAPGRLLVAGAPGCWESTRPGIWSVDVATGEVDEVLPPPDDPDEPVGVLGWTTWR